MYYYNKGESQDRIRIEITTYHNFSCNTISMTF